MPPSTSAITSPRNRGSFFPWFAVATFLAEATSYLSRQRFLEDMFELPPGRANRSHRVRELQPATRHSLRREAEVFAVHLPRMVSNDPGWKLLVQIGEFFGSWLQNYCDILREVSVEVSRNEKGFRLVSTRATS